MSMDIGRVCVKIAGRDAGKTCVILNIIDSSNVLIDGATRRKKCNVKHLEPLDQVLQLKNNASHEQVAEELKKIGIEAFSPKTKKPMPRQLRKRGIKK
ncbi:50S ribosomal protein L14e [Candidatus Woesearchaeota archaeon]|nr:50S ribosomal protein L14e [Candidatus Woesearchaeota archaeon]